MSVILRGADSSPWLRRQQCQDRDMWGGVSMRKLVRVRGEVGEEIS